MPDLFDSMMNSTCGIYKPGSTAADDYGQPAQDWVQVESAVPCRLSSLGPGKEFTGTQEVATDVNKVFMRPRAYRLTSRHKLVIDGIDYLIMGEPVDPSNMHHHLEVYVQTVSVVVPT